MNEIIQENKLKKSLLGDSKKLRCKISVVLLDASLYVIKSTGGKKELLTEEQIFEDKQCSIKGDEVRPDIIHNSLLMLLDSPLCKSGCLSEVIISNFDGKLIKVNPKFRVPRSFKLFSKVFSEFLTSPTGELKLPNEDKTTLLSLMGGTVEEYLSESGLVVGFSRTAIRKENFPNFIKTEVANRIEDSNKVVFVMGATSGNKSCEKYSSYYSYYISICELSIPTYICCSKICSELEEALKIF